MTDAPDGAPDGPDAPEEALGERFLVTCYDDMRRIARRIVAGDGLRAMIQPTDLVNEAAMRLLQAREVAVGSRGHMLALAARTMRRVLIDEARKASAGKRQRPELVTTMPGWPQSEPIDMHALDRALAALEAFSPDHARIVELRFMLGLSVEETAAATGMAERTVKRRWQSARAWLHDHLADGDDAARR